MPLFRSPADSWTMIEEAGLRKCGLLWHKTLLMGIVGGIFIAFGATLMLAVSQNLPTQDAGYVKLLQGVTFPVGLVLIVMCGMELVTGNMMILTAALISHTNIDVLKGLLLNWWWSYVGNFAGCVFVAYFFCYLTDIYASTAATGPTAKIIALSMQKCSIVPIEKLFLRAIACNMCVCLSVFMSFATKDVCGRVTVVWMGIFIFVSSGWEHTVANMFFLPLGLMLGAPSTFGECMYHNILPVTAGNFVGGAVFVSGLFGFFYGHFTPMNSEVAKKLATGVELSAAEAQGAHIFTDASAREMETMPSQSQVPISYTKYYRAKDGHIVEAKVTGHIVPAQGVHTSKFVARVSASESVKGKIGADGKPAMQQKDGLIVTEVDKNGEPTELDFVDNYICELLGYTKQELEHHALSTVLVPESQALIERQAANLPTVAR